MYIPFAIPYDEAIANVEFSDSYYDRRYARTMIFVKSQSEVLAKCILFVNPAHTVAYRPVTTIGCIEMVDDAAVVLTLVAQVQCEAKQLGMSHIVGPLNGSTWYPYRCKATGEANAFPMDVNHPEYYSSQLKAAGFTSLKRYVTTLHSNAFNHRRDVSQLKSRYEDQGLVIRPIDIENIEAELKAIGRLINGAFCNSLLFNPISLDDFCDLYLPHTSLFADGYVFIAEDASSDIHGLMFAYPAYDADTIVLKTIARKPNSPFKGITPILYEILLNRMSQQGKTNVIHALMAEDNLSYVSSQHYTSQVMATYELYTLSC